MSPTPGPRLVVLGAINWDTTVFERRFALPGEEVPAVGLEEGPGGKGANAAVAAARILGRGSVAFLGALGRDTVAPPLLESLAREGVLTEGVVEVPGVSSGRAFIVVDGSGQKTIHTHFGANDAYSPEHVGRREAAALLSGAEVVVLMDVPLATARAARALAPAARVIYSPGVRVSGDAGDLRRIAGGAQELVLDRSELAKLTSTTDPDDGVRTLKSRFPGATIVATLGPEGCLVCAREKISVVEPVDLADLNLSAVNSTGSGDAFLGAYASYTMMGLPPDEAARWGNLAGALKAASPETRGSPSREALEEKMDRLNSFRKRPLA